MRHACLVGRLCPGCHGERNPALALLFENEKEWHRAIGAEQHMIRVGHPRMTTAAALLTLQAALRTMPAGRREDLPGYVRL